MADQAKDNGPYTLHGRRTVHEGEVRIDSHDDLDDAKGHANDLIDTSVWHQVDVRDRDSRTVHTGRREAGYDPTNTEGGNQPAA